MPQGADIKVFIGIRIKIPENAFHFLKCQGIKNYFQTKITCLIKIISGKMIMIRIIVI